MGERTGRTVSVVDDDQSLRRSVSNLLTSVGFRVDTFASAEEFLSSSQQENTGCLGMGGMNGFDLLRHLAATGSRIPVIILTAHADDEARQRSREAGAVAIFGKPFRADALLNAVERVLGHDIR